MAQERPLSLHPLKFDEAITDLLKIKPMPKPDKGLGSKRKESIETLKSKLGNRGRYAKKDKPKGSGFGDKPTKRGR